MSYIAPWQGFWAEVDGGANAPTFTFDASFVDPSQNPPFYGLRVGSSTFAVDLELHGTLLPAEGPAQAGDGGKPVADLANRIRFEPDAMAAWDRHDGSKFLPPISTEGYALLSLEGTRKGAPYRQSVRSLPADLDHRVTIPVDFLSGAAGDFTISAEPRSLPDGWSVTLTDLQTSTETNLLDENYAFTGMADSTWQERFEITIAPAGVSGGAGEPVAFRLSNPAPNPATRSTALVLRLPAGKAGVPEVQHVTARVYDALGRRVATAYDGSLSAGKETRLEIDTSALAAGVYVVRVEGEMFTETRRFAVIR